MLIIYFLFLLPFLCLLSGIRIEIGYVQAAFGVFIATYYRPRIVVVLALWQAVVFTLLFGNFFWCAPLADPLFPSLLPVLPVLPLLPSHQADLLDGISYV